MSEFISHGKNVTASESVCLGLDSVLKKQCYFGLGNGITYFEWDHLGDHADGIIREAVSVCNGLSEERDTCITGAISGLDHLFEGEHGSSLTFDMQNPFSLCTLQTAEVYQSNCYERMIPTINYHLGPDFTKNFPVLTSLIRTIPLPSGRHLAMTRVGITLSETEGRKNVPQYADAVKRCTAVASDVKDDCLWGFYYTIFQNAKAPGTPLTGMTCQRLSFVNSGDLAVCRQAQEAALQYF
jgi:hypothetical protein